MSQSDDHPTGVRTRCIGIWGRRGSGLRSRWETAGVTRVCEWGCPSAAGSIERNGGSIQAETNEGPGARFLFSVPAARDMIAAGESDGGERGESAGGSCVSPACML
jgi:hypothetical protein